ncbi:hypothetical protein [Vandammella animalimorsus]|uniref:Uncharacterized protein n=1 Tax=Vandammella animalimorsus TaxID=2029117 RepID=A0A2A2AXB8_9BURK|nr:hypothetical protein [Vandammella animalimorsus]PAT42476.1 hypothetical protein CK621_09060 [Vandammella animalimorsus]
MDVAVRAWLALLFCFAAPLSALLLLSWPWQLGLGLPLFAVYFYTCGPLLAWFSQRWPPIVKRRPHPVRIAVLLACMAVTLVLLALFKANI